jgi:rSAM/selenodomain-associated transferase 1
MKNDKNEDNAIIVFVKNPVAGKVKTRLASALGDQAALEIYLGLVSLMKKNLETVALPVYVYYSDFVDFEDDWPSDNVFKNVQSSGDLGERMADALRHVLTRHKKAVLVGSDCPGINKQIMEEAFRSLDSNDMVIGPARDGGYYLIGMKRLYEDVFRQMPWSTGRVLQVTLEKCQSNSVTVSLLPELYDIDTEEDYLSYVAEQNLREGVG